MIVLSTPSSGINGSLKKLLYEYIILFIAVIIISLAFIDVLWPPNVTLVHTAFEAVYLFIALSTFLIVFLTYETCSMSGVIIGFGFIMSALYGIMRMVFLTSPGIYPCGDCDISIKFWLLGRLTEASMLLLSTLIIKHRKPNKWILLLAAALFSSGLTELIAIYNAILPTMAPSSGLPVHNIIIEYFIIAVFLLVLFRLIRNLDKNFFLNYKYFFLAVMFGISAEFCFTYSGNANSYLKFLGHLLEILYYSYLFKGIFVSTVSYPYAKLQEANDKLSNSQADLWEILNGLPLGLIAFDNNLTISFANNKVCNMLECSPEDIVGLSREQFLSRFFPECEVSKNRIHYGEVENSLYKRTLKTCLTMKGNSIKLNFELFKYNSGAMASFSDAKGDQELLDLKIQSKTILESVNSLMVVLDKNKKVIICNKSLMDFIEMDLDEIIEKDVHELLKGLNLSVTSGSFNSIDAFNATPTEAFLFTRKGHQKNILMNVSSINNIDNDIIGYICIFTDITKMKDEQFRMQQQEKLALIGQMGSGIVHETKNLLASVKGYCQLLELKMADEHLIYYVKRIESVSNDINRVIADFLSLAKPAETEMDLISLNELIEDMRYMLESPSFVKGVSVNLHLSDNEMEVLADSSQIKQVILNIVKNGIEAMSDMDKPVMDITTMLNKGKNEMQVIITDNGMGIPEENITKLGTPFFTTKEYGTGLGLNVCYRIIAEHKGKIRVSSKVNKGTAFAISLPCYDTYSNDLQA